MPDPLANLHALYNRYDCRPPKHLLEAALTGKTQLQLAVERLRGEAKWNTAKADDWDRAARLADKSTLPGAYRRSVTHRENAEFHRRAARRQYREIAKLVGKREGQAA